MASPAISVVICTRNRPDTILQSVESVLACTHPDFDVTVIDQSSSSATGQILRSHAHVDRRLRYQHVAETGLSRAYNTGIRASAGELLVFTDDDCTVPQEWLSRIVRAFEDEEAELLYGQVLAPPPALRPKGYIPAWSISQPERLSRRDGFRICGMGANFAARRRLFSRIGGFDETLGGGAPLASTQDFDLAYRAYLAGAAILLRPDVYVTHHGVRLPEEWPATIRSYGIGMGGFYIKHIRCGDLKVARMFLTDVTRRMAKEVWQKGRGSKGETLLETRAIIEGVRRSLQFGIDTRQRIYVPR